ncbi:P-loop containing nucleoside triphosphate hydrolase protein [Xylariaceae sp. FL1651]|nr:P-loop containing nucleoside triphosphate hydrolase protein [Xylariaceae sp. FL1651]
MMARTSRRGNEDEDSSSSEWDTEAPNDEEQHQALEGMDIAPIKLNSTGEAEASALGYSSKLVSNWYRHTCSYASCPERWCEFDNVSDEDTALIARTVNIPIIHRFFLLKGKWITTSITIQDVSMRRVLEEVLKKYQDLDLHLDNYTFEPPYMPLCHRWETLKQYRADANEPSLKNAASALLAFLTPIVAASVASVAQTRTTGKVSFKNVWQIFPPNELVSTKFYGVEATCRVTGYKKRPADAMNPAGWIITMKYVDWNGEKSGFANTSLTIWDYDGYRRVTSLPVFPTSFLDDEASYKISMIDRGRKFEQFRGYHFMIANGTKIVLDTKKPEQRPIAGKVCVDAHAYYTSCNMIKPSLQSLSGVEYDEEDTVTDDSESSETPHDSKFTAVVVDSDTAAKGPSKRAEHFQPLTDEQRLLAAPWVKGFDLKSKHWCELRVDQLQPMTWNDEAFEKLVLPGDEKHLAWEFVEAKSLSNSGDFDDFIPDKGRGLIILMFGPPGVGKTFTAEAVAEKSRVPLYAMSAGDLGTQPADVEKALERALNLCRMWNAMLLLDEADVFLGARTADSIARNELVSIFLRMLEYYQGTLFLTTNRVASIDPAFQSRVDLFLPYYDLTSKARREVWNNFIERAGRNKFNVTDESLEKLSHLPLNGREIKNLIKSAQLLSFKSGAKVSMDRVYMLADKRVQALQVVGESSRPLKV